MSDFRNSKSHSHFVRKVECIEERIMFRNDRLPHREHDVHDTWHVEVLPIACLEARTQRNRRQGRVSLGREPKIGGGEHRILWISVETVFRTCSERKEEITKCRQCTAHSDLPKEVCRPEFASAPEYNLHLDNARTVQNLSVMTKNRRYNK